MSQRQPWGENILGCLFIVILASFFGLIYYACEAYPKTEIINVINPTHCTITLRLGSLCDSPGKLISDFEKANSQAKVEGYQISRAWNGETILELRIKKK